MRWWKRPGILPFDVRGKAKERAGWYRFTSPPGLRGMTIQAFGKVRVWADGKPLAIEERGTRDDGSTTFEAAVGRPEARPVTVAIRIEPERGSYGGAAIPDPIALRCGPGLLDAGDWSRIDGLACYSGGAWYRKTVDLPGLAGRRAVLDLGGVVSSAEVRVNGKPAGIRVAPPWMFDVTAAVRPGANRIEVLVYNTVANHYLTIPTRYRGSTVSGLLGPARIVIGEAAR
jgi:hypothetical protein